METEIEKRGPGRPRKEDVAIRSAGRSGPIRERKRKGGQLNNPFHVDLDSIPDGMSYEWKRVTLKGMSDPSYEVEMREQGWDPVDGARHPDLVLEGHKGPIIRGGLMLMERPMELTEEARREDIAAARDAVSVKQQQLGETPAGTLPRDVPALRNAGINKINKSYEPMPIDG